MPAHNKSYNQWRVMSKYKSFVFASTLNNGGQVCLQKPPLVIAKRWQQLGWTMTTTLTKYILFILSLGIFSCDHKATPDNLIYSDKDSTTATGSNSSENFNEFLTRFNGDTVFKLSRIVFPIEQDIKDPIEGNDAIIIYNRTDGWIRTINLEYQPKYHDNEELEFVQDTVWTKDQVVIRQRGSYPGTHITWDMDFQFGLIDGKWYLLRLKDFSYL